MVESSVQPASEVNLADLVRRFNDCVNRQDLAGMRWLVTEDVVFENTHPPPDGARYEGWNAFQSFWQDFFQAAPNAFFDLEEVLVAGDRCVTRWRYVWNEQAGPRGYIRGVDLFRFRDGKIAEKLSYVKG